MANLFHQIQYWAFPQLLLPGQAVLMSFGPSSVFSEGTTQVTCCPDTLTQDPTYGSYYTITKLTVSDFSATQVPVMDARGGALMYNNRWFSFKITNSGDSPVKYFSVALTVIGP